ncbi:MAG TPA: long-chain-acyl-CoA synthetase [Gemmatimonadaceae bacterium]|jgi:fatty-acyl-CoA synthase|nr:long-chain-acyl-CoA synthetase [Gemmatimonadaceae bacterium]
MTQPSLAGDTPNKAWARALALTAPIARDPETTLPILMGQLADKYGDNPALVGEDETLTYRELSVRANRYARWTLQQGIAPGEVVCLVMQNCPDYLAAWLGITRTGAVAALVNTNLVGESLAHAIRVVSPKCILLGADLAPSLTGIESMLEPSARRWVRGGAVKGMSSVDVALTDLESTPLTVAECALPTTHDRALYIYTSGTTGLPKAAKVSHHRLLQWSYWFAGMLDTTESDRMYNCLPMYHSVGGVVAIGALLVNGGSVVLRRKFSSRAFWEDIVHLDCTLFQYIGELCRFLLSAPTHARERDHRIRVACGNGLRPDIWEAFRSRFGIPRILEFYAATEANFSLYNCEGKPGAIGRIPPFLVHRFPVALVRCNAHTGEPIRNEDGLCDRCGVDEIGEALGRIAHDGSAEGRFDGYTDPAASERKILRDVFKKGDAWFRSGDLMRRDSAGFLYFVDRIGDTFRWKGENVATGEVAEAVCAWPEVRDATVYGVEVPGHDGRAGMVAVVTDGELDLSGLRSHLSKRLPEYARPVFVRLVSAIESTGTFKPTKQGLVSTGFNPGTTADVLYVNDRERDSYVRLDSTMFDQIRAGRFRF